MENLHNILQKINIELVGWIGIIQNIPHIFHYSFVQVPVLLMEHFYFFSCEDSFFPLELFNAILLQCRHVLT